MSALEQHIPVELYPETNPGMLLDSLKPEKPLDVAWDVSSTPEASRNKIFSLAPVKNGI